MGTGNQRRYTHGYNHKVVRVDFLSEREDVYCLVVPGLNNFALAAGVFVHNCGMAAVETSLTAKDLPENLHELRSAIEAAVPHGRTENGRRRDRGAWGDPPDVVRESWGTLAERFERISKKHPLVAKSNNVTHLGTLGTGNHFIEVCLDERDHVWFMLHSGSRGVGNRIGSYFIELAKEDMRIHFINLPDADLAYLSEGTEHFTDYVEAVSWAQDFARRNPQIMMENVVRAARGVKGIPPFTTDGMAVNCHHNYAEKETHYGKSG